MRVFSTVFVVTLFVSTNVSSEPASAPKIYSSASAVDAAIAKARAEHKGDNTNTVEPLLSIGPYPVYLEYRTGETPPSVHTGLWEFIHVIRGSAALREGGTLIDGKGPPNMIVGKSIAGGSTRIISEGDYIAIPFNTPHQFVPQKTPFIMMSVHIDAPAK